MSLPITTLYAALSGLLIIVLSWQVVRHRTAKGGDNASLQRAIRTHANFTEYVPLALLLLLIAELNGVAAVWLHANGVALLIARGIHAWGLSRHDGRSFGRFWGTAVTWLVILAMSVTLLVDWVRAI